MGAFVSKRRRRLAVSSIVAAVLSLGIASDAFGDGVGMFMVSKSLPEATVAVIDPESGTSSGGGTTDVRLAVGDVILFRFNFFPVPDGQIHGINGWLTEYVPRNTQVVGVRLIDANGNTVRTNYPGLASNDCGATCNGFNSVPCTPGVGGCPASGTRNLDDGSIAQLYADTGIFYTSDTRLNRNPGTAFITFLNGIAMSPPPRYVSNVDGLLGHTGSTYYAHNRWDWIQVAAFGAMPSASGNNGSGNTPHGYGSPVAGPLTHYQLEASEPTTGNIRFNNVVGPWNRIVYPGSTIGTGSAVTGSGTEPTRMLLDASTMGLDVTPASPLPTSTRALRWAMGEIRVGEPIYAEVALRVLGTPIDPVHGIDADCAESFGGDISARSATTRAKDNPWGLYLGSPGCVYLNLLFDLTNDRPLTVVGDTVNFTLRTRNLSTQPRTNAVVVQKFDSSRVAYVGPLAGTPTPAVVGNCEGDGLTCLVWPARTYLPSDETIYETRFTTGGGGHITHTMHGHFTSTGPTPPGTTDFRTQSLIMTRAVGVVDPTLAYTGTSTAAGGTAPLSGDVGVVGTNNVAFDEYIPVLPPGWTVTNTGGASTPDILWGGVRLECSANCATNRPEFNLATDLPAASRRSISFSVNVPGGTAPGLYPISLSIWASQTAFGGRYETYFRDIATVAVGQPRAPAPSINCPCTSPPPPEMPECGHWSSVSTITGTGAPAGSTVRVYLNGILRGSGTAAADGTWAVDVSSFGPLYGGIEIRVTADGATTLESVLSSTCFTRDVRACSDGLDNDGDGLADFPADPGCSSLGDGDETDVQCSDGIDNDGDGRTDWPDDPECSAPDDTTEGGPAACNDGIDNDGDGAVDVADPCCTTSTDRSETCFRQCNDRLDNDADALVDFTPDPGCHAMNDDQELDLPDSTDINARLLVVFDTSGSMNWNTCTEDFTGGDGTLECPGNDVACSACTSAGCGDATANDARIDKAKRGLYNAVAAYGEVEWGLMRFHQRATTFSCPSANASAQSGGWQGAGAAPCGGGFNAGDLLVGFDTENQYDLLEWVDGASNYPGGAPPAGMDFELRGTGTTPIAGSLTSARTFLTAERSADTVASCRPYRVILITDGIETCGGNPVTAATALNTAGFRVHVIGFAVADASARTSLNNIASAGGTTSAIFVDDETTLSAAISDIVADTVLVETCNNLDDDCDTLIDEGFAKYCNRPGGVTTATLCADPGETVCDMMDDNCNGLVDEGLLNACGVCGPTPGEVCDRIDNDCDGAIDEGGVCTCPSPSPEICDNADNDCDGTIDEGLTRSCGTDVGACTSGLETCTFGVWGGCTGTGPFTEVCDNVDNDCDGVIDGITRPCGTDVGVCATGLETCTAGAWGMCTGGIGPGTEVCNTLDDDCDSSVDEGNPGGGAACGGAVGECTAGTLNCTMGMLVCTGGTGPTMELCDTLDNDCDSLVDEGNPGGGAACGATDVGECDFGSLTCMGGALVCTGERGPSMELCDGLDNDCDTMIDEGDPEAGAACGDDTGECMEGITRCVGGMLTCEGGVGPVPEVCNALDDDCDGVVDDGIPVGAPCGTDTGECVPGLNICRDGMIVCEGGIDPIPEECDALDNDCDSRVDEGLGAGAACGMDEGLCMAGMIQCIGGRERCVGEVPPSREACDCEDNDCDGTVDEAPMVGTLCPAGSECIDCQCALPCMTSEFAPPCPSGRVPLMRGDECWCVGELCNPDDCATETVEVDGVVRCAPDSSGVPSCVCKENECTYPCNGVVCEDGFVCSRGTCVPDMCPFTDCPEGELCDPIAGACYADPCATVTCGADEACRLGSCEPSCADASCGAGERCAAGVCVTDNCDGVSCPASQACDPADGSCVDNMCIGRTCSEGTICDPVTGDCVVDPCIPLHCPGDEICIAGECAPSGTMPDAGVERDAGPVVRDDAGPGRFDAGDHDPEFRILATGGGGCACNVPGRDAGGGDEPWWAALLVLAAVLRRFRRRSR